MRREVAPGKCLANAVLPSWTPPTSTKTLLLSPEPSALGNVYFCLAEGTSKVPLLWAPGVRGRLVFSGFLEVVLFFEFLDFI